MLRLWKWNDSSAWGWASSILSLVQYRRRNYIAGERSANHHHKARDAEMAMA